MSNLNYTYEDLCEVVPILTRNSSSPTTVADLNPLIKLLLSNYPKASIYSLGGHSVLLDLTDEVVAKVSLKSDSPHLRHEQQIQALLDQTPCPNIVQSYFRGRDVTFMQRLDHGTLFERLSRTDQPKPYLKWMRQLSEAAACLELHGYAHGDINPRNILFDEHDQLKLVDFDHALKIGEDLEVGYEPYVQGRRYGDEGGYYGVAGPRTELMALGSIFWFMTRGTELYAELEGPDQVDRIIAGQFPEVNPHDPVDCIIRDCWLYRFPSIAALCQRIREVEMFDDRYQARKQECEGVYARLIEVPRFGHGDDRPGDDSCFPKISLASNGIASQAG